MEDYSFSTGVMFNTCHISRSEQANKIGAPYGLAWREGGFQFLKASVSPLWVLTPLNGYDYYGAIRFFGHIRRSVNFFFYYNLTFGQRKMPAHEGMETRRNFF